MWDGETKKRELLERQFPFLVLQGYKMANIIGLDY